MTDIRCVNSVELIPDCIMTSKLFIFVLQNSLYIRFVTVHFLFHAKIQFLFFVNEEGKKNHEIFMFII